MSQLSINALSKSYGSFKVFDGLNLDPHFGKLAGGHCSTANRFRCALAHIALPQYIRAIPTHAKHAVVNHGVPCAVS